MSFEYDSTLGAMLRSGYTHCRHLPDGTLIGLKAMWFTCDLFVGLDVAGYARRYCYESQAIALDAFERWVGTGDPPGNWIVVEGELTGDRLGPGAVE